MTFQPGQSGNPKGRPKGIVDKRAELRGLLDVHAKAIVEKLIEGAKAGDPISLRLCIERLIPRIKPDNSIIFDLPEGRINEGSNMLGIVDGITKAVVLGQMDMEEAQKFTDFLKRQCRFIKEAEQKLEDEKREKEWEKRWGSSPSSTSEGS